MSRPPRRSVLVLEPDVSHAHTIEHILHAHVGDVDVHHSESPAQAEVYLQSACFDAVIIRYEETLEEWLARADLSDPAVFILTEGAVDLDGLSAHGACLPLRQDQDASWHQLADLLSRLWHDGHDGHAHSREDGAPRRQRNVLEALDEAASSLKHEINNPLSVIAGNAQLLLELASIRQLDDDVVEAIRNIETAARRASQLTGQLKQLRRQVMHQLYDASSPSLQEDRM